MARAAAPPPLAIRLKRHPDGSASITLTRAGGTVTWQRQKGSLALVFPSHDLTHYAVEQALGYRHGFYGLVADGWEISDFAMPWARGPIPGEAREVELLVGLFDGMHPDRAAWDADAINAQFQRLAAESRLADLTVPRPLGAHDVQRVRALRAALLERWAATAPGHALHLEFTRLPPSP